MATFFVLTSASGHNTVHVLADRTEEEVRKELIGFAKSSDDETASFTKNKEIADSWEKSCPHFCAGQERRHA